MTCYLVGGAGIAVLVAVQFMKLIERRSVEGWEDENGFHLGRGPDEGA